MPSLSNSSSSGMADATVSKFTKLLPLSIRKEGGAVIPGVNDTSGGMHQAEQKEHVRVTLSYPSAACGAMNPHKEITLRLTNDENPMFFFHLRITEADFPELKSQQGLLVDFYGFPNQLVTLLEKCDPNYMGGESPPDSKGFGISGNCGPKFVLVMKIGANAIALLDIVESNPFKYLCHLSLQINAGSDAEVKKYLCDVTTSLKKDYLFLKDKYNHLASTMEDETSRLKAQLEQKVIDMNDLRDQIHAQANSFSTKHFEDMTQEKEKLLKLQSELANKFELDKVELDRRHSQTVGTLEERISGLEMENRELLQNKYKIETTLQDATNKIKHYENDLRLLQQEITLTRKQNEKLDQDYHEKQRITGSLHSRVSTLEADLKEKQTVMQRQHEQFVQMSEQKRFLEEHTTGMVKEVEKVKSVNKMVSAELIKANEIIKKLQDDLRNLNSKCRLQAHVTSEQERAISDRDKEIHQLQTDSNILKTQVSSSEVEMKQLGTKIGESETKIEELEKTIKSNENMISWLNKQLNEFQGLSNLSKFRQNLATNNSTNQPRQFNLQAPVDSSKFTGSMEGTRPISNAPTHKYDRLTSAGVEMSNRYLNPPESENSNGKRHFIAGGGGAFSNNQSQNTLPNGTPSWMHIYQSTSTPLEDDLSSRLEKVNATNGLHMNYKSHFTDRFENGDGDNNNTPQDVLSSEKKEEESAITAKNTKTVRPPTWARGRGGKVTLGLSAVASVRNASNLRR